MATGQEIEIKVVVEKAIHDALQETFQRIWDDHGVCIHEVATDWLVIHQTSDTKMRLQSIRMRTSNG